MNKGFKLAEYMSDAIERIVDNALRASLKNPRETAFLFGYLLTSKKAAAARKKYEDRGEHIPPFLIGSITSNCNLYCKGCYARENKSCGEGLTDSQLSSERWSELFNEAKELGISFILLAGGEPLLRRDVIERAAEIKNIVFPVFTNGTMFDEAYIDLFNKNRNLVPVLSIEGDKFQTDRRRGAGTYDTLMDVMSCLAEKGIFYGVSITVTTENIETVIGGNFIEDIYERGCKIIFYVEYVPVTSKTKHLAPTDKERDLLSTALLALREKYDDMLFLSFPGDEEVTGGCLAAGRGFFHINAAGGAEPCPFSPYSDISLKDCSLFEALQSSLFKRLNQDGMLIGEHSGGCLLFEKDELVKSMVQIKI